MGNFDSNGANVNRNEPDNSNSNIGVVFSRKFHKKKPLNLGRLFAFLFTRLVPIRGYYRNTIQIHSLDNCIRRFDIIEESMCYMNRFL